MLLKLPVYNHQHTGTWYLVLRPLGENNCVKCSNLSGAILTYKIFSGSIALMSTITTWATDPCILYHMWLVKIWQLPLCIEIFFWAFSMFTYGYYLEKNVGDACGPIFLQTIYSQYTYKVRYNSRTTATCVQLWNKQPRKKCSWWEGRKRQYAHFWGM